MLNTTNDTNNNDTSLIDDKKNPSTSQSIFSSPIFKFIISLIILIIFILFYISSSGLILFLCKLAQSNILPTNADCAPYSNNEPDIRPSPIQTNIFTTFTNPALSVKLEIPYKQNSKHSLLDSFNDYKNNPSSSFLGNYFVSVIESMMRFNYSGLNYVMNTMNEWVPEFLIVAIGPLITPIFYLLGLFLNPIYLFWTWFKNMHWFFKINKNETGDGKPQWENINIFNPIQLFLAIYFVFLFTCIYFGTIILCLFSRYFALITNLLFLMFYYYILGSTLFYKGKMNGRDVSSFSIVIETIKYYKSTILGLISLFFILYIYFIFGMIPAVSSIITLILIYLGTIPIGLSGARGNFNQTPVVSYRQAIKVCTSQESKESRSFIYNVFLFMHKSMKFIMEQIFG